MLHFRNERSNKMKKKIRKQTMVLLSVILLAGAVTSKASIKITGVTIEDVSSEFNSSGYWPARAEKLLGPGLDINGPDTHSTVWAGTYTEGDIGTMWACGVSNPNGVYVMFDLGQVYANLDFIKIWNFNRPGQTYNQGIGDIDILVSDTKLPVGDPGWILDSSVTLTEAPGDDTTPFGDEFTIKTANVRYVLLDIKTKLNGDPAGYLVGLSEVAFYEVPEPAMVGLLLCGMFGVLKRR